MEVASEPGSELPGYSQISLRETPDEQPLLFEERRAEKCPNDRAWLRETVKCYPEWVREVIANNPAWIEARLAKNPHSVGA